MCKEDLNWQERMKAHMRYAIYKIIGTPNIIRIIEWRSMLEYLNLKEGKKNLDVACGGGRIGP